MSFPLYDAFKDSGAEWLGDVPRHWKIDRLKRSVAAACNGVWGDDPLDNEGDIACVRVADFDRTRLLAGASVPTIRNVPEKDRRGRMLSKNDLLLEKSGGGEGQPVGQVVLYDSPNPAVCSNFIARMVPVLSMDASFLRYLHAAAYAVRLNVRSIKQTSGIQNLDQSQYLDELVAYPPKLEQSAIAAFLDRETAKIDALVEQQQRLIALLEEKRQAVISHAVTKGLDPDAPMKDSGVEWLGEVPAHWEVRTVSSLSTKITNGYVGPTRDILVDEGVRYLQSLHIKGNSINFDTPYYVRENWSREHSKSILETGDVLVVQTGDIGQVAVVTNDFAGCNCHALIIISPVRAVIGGDWLSWVLNGDYGRHSLLSIQTGALHPHLNCGNVKGIFIPIPLIEEQKNIVAFINTRIKEFDALISEAEAAIALLQERRSALISAAVTGKIDVRGLAPQSAEAA